MTPEITPKCPVNIGLTHHPIVNYKPDPHATPASLLLKSVKNPLNAYPLRSLNRILRGSMIRRPIHPLTRALRLITRHRTRHIPTLKLVYIPSKFRSIDSQALHTSPKSSALKPSGIHVPCIRHLLRLGLLDHIPILTIPNTLRTTTSRYAEGEGD